MNADGWQDVGHLTTVSRSCTIGQVTADFLDMELTIVLYGSPSTGRLTNVQHNLSSGLSPRKTTMLNLARDSGGVTLRLPSETPIELNYREDLK